jgi:hypothetical protein
MWRCSSDHYQFVTLEPVTVHDLFCALFCCPCRPNRCWRYWVLLLRSIVLCETMNSSFTEPSIFILSRFSNADWCLLHSWIALLWQVLIYLPRYLLHAHQGVVILLAGTSTLFSPKSTYVIQV